MSIGLVIFIALIGIPLIEIAVFIEVGGRIGLGMTLVLIFATAAIGAGLIRHQGLSVLADARRATDKGELPVQALLDGVCLLVAGAMLLTPGFVTDGIGSILLIPPLRRLLQVAVLGWLSTHGEFSARASARRGPTIIDGEFCDDDDDPTNTPPSMRLPPQ